MKWDIKNAGSATENPGLHGDKEHGPPVSPPKCTGPHTSLPAKCGLSLCLCTWTDWGTMPGIQVDCGQPLVQMYSILFNDMHVKSPVKAGVLTVVTVAIITMLVVNVYWVTARFYAHTICTVSLNSVTTHRVGNNLCLLLRWGKFSSERLRNLISGPLPGEDWKKNKRNMLKASRSTKLKPRSIDFRAYNL